MFAYLYFFVLKGNKPKTTIDPYLLNNCVNKSHKAFLNSVKCIKFIVISNRVFYMSLTILNVFSRLCVFLSTLKVFLPSLRVFVNFKYLFAVFACLCLSLGVFVDFKHLFAIFACLYPSLCVFVNFKRFFLPSLRVFVCLCASLLVFVCLCVVWVSLRYLDRPLFFCLFKQRKMNKQSTTIAKIH